MFHSISQTEQSSWTHQKYFLQEHKTLTFRIIYHLRKSTICTIPTISKDSITLKILKLYKYHAEQTNYKTEEKKIKLVDSTSLTCLIFLE